ncbi:alpha/beta hydrolase [Promicromonospora sp. NPDC060204]|uniref:alpha/beta hydrolase n=1 Tax=Promicromonospora sp. NPDC060204 TaxID=3347071 RepID=UPI0036677165
MLTVVAGLVGALLAAPAASAGARAGTDVRAGTPTAAPDWGACPDDVVTTVPLECATVPVPLDHDAPEGEQIDVMISRLASTQPERRRGVLLLNPGGPGGSGLAQPADLAQRGIPDTVLDAYDLIGMDPRGVGHSSPVSCGFTADQDYRGNIPPYAPDDAAVTAQARAAKQIADQCAAHDTDGRMRHMTTGNTARDVDLIRAVLGEEKLSFYGASYGTALGAAYASLFPERSDRVVLDSNLGATSLDYDAQRRFGLGMEDRFPDFARWAAARHDSYGLGRTPREVRAGYLELAGELDQHPADGLDGAFFRFLMFVQVYTDESFPAAAQLWQALADGDVAAARGQAQETLRSTVPGTPAAVAQVPAAVAEKPAAAPTSDAAAPSPFDNAWSSYLAVTCNDTDWPEDVETYRAAVAADRERYPLYGGASANITPCAFWHDDPVDAPVEFTTEGPENVLVLQNLRDPGTPHLGGRLTREAFGDRARLVSVDAGGHGVYVYGPNHCALNTTTRFLVDGDLPRRDMFCRP